MPPHSTDLQTGIKIETNERDRDKMEEEQAENVNIAENQNDTNVMQAEIHRQEHG